MKKVVLLLVLLGAVALGSGCKSMVYFRSNPPGAQLHINGIPRGETPCTLELKWHTFKTFDVTLEKEGYRPHVARLQGEPKWTFIIIDILFWPLVFVNGFGPKPAYSFNLTPLGEAPAPGPSEKPPGPVQGKAGEVVVYENVEKKPRMACLEFRRGTEDAARFITAVQEMFCTGFVESRRFSIIEREQIEKILKERQFAQTGDVDAETARRLGKVLGVSYLLIGSMSKLGETFEVDARLVDVDTGETKTASHGSCSSATGLRATVNTIVNDLNRKFSGQ